MTNKHANEILFTLQKTYSLPDLASLKQWGPVIEYQYDASGQTPIQRFVTLLVRLETGAWLLCRQISGIQNGQEWPARPIVREVNDLDAECWMREHKVAASEK